MQFKQRNIATMLVAKSMAVTGTDFVTKNIQATKGSMATGQVTVVNSAGVAVDGATAATLTPTFMVVQKLADGTLKMSGTIDATKVKKVTVHKYLAGSNQVDYIGYNGTTGSIEVTDNNVYKVNITYRGTDAFDASRMTIKHGVYKSDSAATQSEIAAGLTNSLITNFSREGIKLKYGLDLIKFERVCSHAGTEALSAADTFVGTAGSKMITIVESGGDLPYLFAVGDYIRMGTAVTSPVYKITATTVTTAAGGVLTLDIPLQTSVSYTGTGYVEYITAAEAAASNFGIKMTGTELPYSAINFNYGRSAWITGLQDFGATTVTSTAMTLGSGNGKTVNELESWIAFNRGNWYPYATGATLPTLHSLTTGSYALINIAYKDEYVTEMGHSSDTYAELWLACEKGNVTHYSDANTGIGTVIDAYATKYGWDIAYVGASGTAAVLAIA